MRNLGQFPPPLKGEVVRRAKETTATPKAPNEGDSMQKRLSHLIAETTTDAFVAIDTQNCVIYWNRGAKQLFGWSAEEMVGQQLDQMIPVNMRPLHHHGMNRVSSGVAPNLVGKTTEVIALTRDGREVPVELSLTLWRNSETGLPEGFAAIMRDVSERKQLAEERNELERKMNEKLAAIEATTDGVATTDAEGRFTYMNAAHARMFGFEDPAETVGMHWSALYSPEEAAKIEQVAVPQVFSTGHWRGEARGLHRDGRVIEQEIALAQGPYGGLVCSTRDIGDRQRTLRERIRTRERLLLAERQEMIGRAVSGLAHDFANLMSVISVSAHSLEARLGTDVRELARIRDGAAQANALLDKILAPEKVIPEEKSVDGRTALQSVGDLTAVSLRPRHRIEIDTGKEELTLAADPTEFMRVLLNLCTNARDALEKGDDGLIRVTMERFPGAREVPFPLIGSVPLGASALIIVEDNGCGISSKDLQQVFEPFHTRKSDGTGLGLAVVADIVAKSGGSVSVESGSWGTRFYLLWPLVATSSRSDSGEDGGATDLSGWRILVTDDNPAVLDLIGAELRNTGAEVGDCDTPFEVLAVLEDDAANWDALVVDHDMPDMTGPELAAIVRSRWPKLPIILCSALHEVVDRKDDCRLFDAKVAKSAIGTGLSGAILNSLAAPKEAN